MKKAKLSDVMADIEERRKECGIPTADESESANLEVVPTGCFSLDYILGCGGLPMGRIMEVFGGESGGKTTLTLFLIAQAQKAGKSAMFIDAERSYSNEYARKIGVDTSKLLLVSPENGEQGFEYLLKAVENKLADIIIVDSVAALLPRKEQEAGISKDTMATHAAMMTRGLKLMNGPAAQNKVSVIFINQVRSKVGVVFGDPETTSGGRALKFYASIRLKVNGKKILEGEEAIGNAMTITAVKNKVAIPFKKATIDVFFAKGVDVYGDLLDSAERVGVVERSGASYSFAGNKLGVGRDAVKQILEGDPKLFEAIRKKLEEKLKEDNL